MRLRTAPHKRRQERGVQSELNWTASSFALPLYSPQNATKLRDISISMQFSSFQSLRTRLKA